MQISVCSTPLVEPTGLVYCFVSVFGVQLEWIDMGDMTTIAKVVRVPEEEDADMAEVKLQLKEVVMSHTFKSVDVCEVMLLLVTVDRVMHDTTGKQGWRYVSYG